MTDKKKALIIEDEKHIADAQGIILGNLYDVHFAYDGEAGLKKAKEVIPDLIVLDLMLPNRGGYDVCFNLRQDDSLKHVKVLMVTALNQNIDKEKGEMVGTDKYLTKPFEPEELLSAVGGLLQS